MAATTSQRFERDAPVAHCLSAFECASRLQVTDAPLTNGGTFGLLPTHPTGVHSRAAAGVRAAMRLFSESAATRKCEAFPLSSALSRFPGKVR